MVGSTPVMTGSVLTCQQRQAGPIACWQQPRAFERRKGAAAARRLEAVEQHHALDHAEASLERIDDALSRRTRPEEVVGHHTSTARASPPRCETSWGFWRR